MQEPLDLLRADIDSSGFQYAFSSRTGDGLHFLYNNQVNTCIMLGDLFQKYCDRVTNDEIYWPTNDDLTRAGFELGEEYDKWLRTLEGEPFLLSFRMK